MTVESEIVLRVVSLDHPHARALEQKLVADLVDRYGGEGPGPVPIEDFAAPRGGFVVAIVDGSPVGCGGFRHLAPGVAEIKRMYVDASARRRGVGRSILGLLEERAAAAGYGEVRLETGTAQAEAITLYTASGYRPIDAYGEFRNDPRSRCFSRALGA